jgi:hypothetical protein
MCSVNFLFFKKNLLLNVINFTMKYLIKNFFLNNNNNIIKIILKIFHEVYRKNSFLRNTEIHLFLFYFFFYQKREKVHIQ